MEKPASPVRKTKKEKFDSPVPLSSTQELLDNILISNAIDLGFEAGRLVNQLQQLGVPLSEKEISAFEHLPHISIVGERARMLMRSRGKEEKQSLSKFKAKDKCRPVKHKKMEDDEDDDSSQGNSSDSSLGKKEKLKMTFTKNNLPQDKHLHEICGGFIAFIVLLGTIEVAKIVGINGIQLDHLRQIGVVRVLIDFGFVKIDPETGEVIGENDKSVMQTAFRHLKKRGFIMGPKGRKGRELVVEKIKEVGLISSTEKFLQ